MHGDQRSRGYPFLSDVTVATAYLCNYEVFLDRLYFSFELAEAHVQLRNFLSFCLKATLEPVVVTAALPARIAIAIRPDWHPHWLHIGISLFVSTLDFHILIEIVPSIGQSAG